jgi:hypothetical protein
VYRHGAGVVWDLAVEMRVGELFHFQKEKKIILVYRRKTPVAPKI